MRVLVGDRVGSQCQCRRRQTLAKVGSPVQVSLERLEVGWWAIKLGDIDQVGVGAVLKAGLNVWEARASKPMTSDDPT